MAACTCRSLWPRVQRGPPEATARCTSLFFLFRTCRAGQHSRFCVFASAGFPRACLRPRACHRCQRRVRSALSNRRRLPVSSRLECFYATLRCHTVFHRELLHACIRLPLRPSENRFKHLKSWLANNSYRRKTHPEFCDKPTKNSIMAALVKK